MFTNISCCKTLQHKKLLWYECTTTSRIVKDDGINNKSLANVYKKKYIGSTRSKARHYQNLSYNKSIWT